MIIISPIFKLVMRIIGIIVSIIVYTGTVISCYGGLISPDITPLGSVATIGMPIMVTISAIITVLWFVFGHWIIGSGGVLMFIICLSPIRMWFPMHFAPKPDPDVRKFTVLTWNTLHGDDLEQPDSKNARMLEEILKQDADIVCLQEIFGFEERFLKHYSQATVDSIFEKYPYRLGDGTYDLRILSKYPLEHLYFGSVHKFNLAEYFVVRFPERRIAMANVHLPSFALNENEKNIFSMGELESGGISEKKSLTHEIIGKLKYAIPMRAEAARKVNEGFGKMAMPIIICGDFNDVPASWTYRLFLKAGFKDAYTATNFFPTYTFYPHAFYFHLDQIFYRGSIKPLSVKRLNIRTSDHLPLLAEFEFIRDSY